MKIRGKITDDQIKNAYELAKEGHTIKVICTSIGVSYDSYSNYRKVRNKNIEQNDDIERFLDAMETGINEFFSMCEKEVSIGVKNNPQFAMEVLSRRKRKEWCKSSFIKQDIKKSITFVEKLSEMSDEELKKKLEEINGKSSTSQ